jgi:hypothetical protein
MLREARLCAESDTSESGCLPVSDCRLCEPADVRQIYGVARQSASKLDPFRLSLIALISQRFASGLIAKRLAKFDPYKGSTRDSRAFSRRRWYPQDENGSEAE